MSVRERFFKAVGRQSGDYIPFDFDLCPHLLGVFREKTGRSDYKDVFRMPMRFCHVPCSIPIPDNAHYARYYERDEADYYSEWGIGIRQGSLAHFVQMLHPMARLSDPEQVSAYPIPDPIADYRWEETTARIAQLKQKDTVVFASNGATLFELAWVLRSMEEFMVDMMERPQMAHALLDKIFDFKSVFVDRFIDAGVDGMQFGDDVGTQRDMMMSVPLWREYLKPRLAALIRQAKARKPDLIVEYHSDGNIERIIPELIEIGVDVLNPVQPECMDPVRIKQQYGDSLSFRGCLGTQTVMPFGTPEQVRSQVRLLAREVGRGGGLVLAPSHVLEPEVPWENILALSEAMEAYQ